MGFWPRPHVIWKLLWKPLGTVYSAHVLQREISLFLVCVAGIMMQSQQTDDRRKLTLLQTKRFACDLQVFLQELGAERRHPES